MLDKAESQFWKHLFLLTLHNNITIKNKTQNDGTPWDKFFQPQGRPSRQYLVFTQKSQHPQDYQILFNFEKGLHLAAMVKKVNS